jgi:hypothetical protein
LAFQKDSSFSQGSDHGQAMRHEARIAAVLEQGRSVIRRCTFTSRRKTMNWTISKALAGGRVAAVVTLTGVLLTASVSRTAIASGSREGLEGAWVVQVTLRDCATNAALGAPFNSLVSFHDGGTLSESAGSLAFAAGQRSPGHGNWTREGRHTFLQRMIALIVFDTPANLPGTPGFNPSLPISPGFFAGWQTVTHTLRLSDGDHATSAGTNEFYKSDGTLYRTGCSTSTAQRFE